VKEQKHTKAADSPSTPVQSPPDFPRRILVVEDKGDIRRFNTEVLIHSGYHVDAADGGAAAWEALQLQRYDLMVTDNNMPVVSGVDLIKKIHAASLALPVIMATASLPTWQFARFPSLLPKAVLLKPYTGDELLKTVNRVLHTNAILHKEIAPPSSWAFNEPASDPRNFHRGNI